ncbi:MAG: MmcQ/YjbR family DNA-binding protein [Actinomycetota bacterium]
MLYPLSYEGHGPILVGRSRSSALLGDSTRWTKSATILLMVPFDVVRELALELPETEETTSYGTPAFKVRKKLFARLREEGDVLVVKVERDERAALIESEPDVYFFTPHYENYGFVLVRLDAVDRDELREILTDSWRLAAPRKFHVELAD